MTCIGGGVEVVELVATLAAGPALAEDRC